MSKDILIELGYTKVGEWYFMDHGRCLDKSYYSCFHPRNETTPEQHVADMRKWWEEHDLCDPFSSKAPESILDRIERNL